MAFRVDTSLSALPLVCRTQAEPHRALVELSLTTGTAFTSFVRLICHEFRRRLQRGHPKRSIAVDLGSRRGAKAKSPLWNLGLRYFRGECRDQAWPMKAR